MTAPSEGPRRVRLVSTDDAYTRLRPGAEGTVTNVDSTGTLHVQWDSGEQLGLIPGEDLWKVLGVPAAETTLGEEHPMSDSYNDAPFLWSGPWNLILWRAPRPGTFVQYNGIGLEQWEGVLELRVLPTVERLRSAAELDTSGSTTPQYLVLRRIPVRLPVEIQFSGDELHLGPINNAGDHLILCPAYAVEDDSAGFDRYTQCEDAEEPSWFADAVSATETTHAEPS